MLARPLPKKINFTQLAEDGRTLHWAVAIDRFDRLCQLGKPVDSDVPVSLKFTKGKNQRTTATGTAAVTLEMVCQTCMEPMTVALEVAIHTSLVKDQDALDTLADEEDGTIVEFPFVDVVELVEDELILALPMVSRHVDSECHAEWQQGMAEDLSVEPQDEDTHRPFADLSKLIDP